MTTEEVELCKKADATIGEVLAPCGVARFRKPPSVWLIWAGIIGPVVMCISLAVAVYYIARMCGAVNMALGFGAIAGFLSMWPVSSLFVIPVFTPFANSHRWFRIAKRCKEVFGDGEWPRDFESLKLGLRAHVEHGMPVITSLPTARLGFKGLNDSLRLAQVIEADFGFDLIPVGGGAGVSHEQKVVSGLA